MSSGREGLFVSAADDIRTPDPQSEAAAEGAQDQPMSSTVGASRPGGSTSRPQAQNLVSVINQLREQQREARESRKRVN